MPAAREMTGSSCSVELEDEWQREEKDSMSSWASPHLTNVENNGGAFEQVQRDLDEDHGAHFNYAHLGVSFS